MMPIGLIAGILAALVFLPVLAFATTPTVTLVSGSIQTDQTLTITGTTMVDHNTASWISNADWNFEGASFSADGYFVPTNDNQGLCARTTSPPYAGITYDSSIKLLGNKSVRFHQSGAFAGPGAGGCYISSYPDPVPGSDFYVGAYVRYDASAGNNEWPDNFLKLFLTVGGGGNEFYFQPNVRTSGAPTQMLMYENYTSTYGDIPSGAIENNRWYYMEARYKNSSPKRYQAWVDGVQIGDWVPQGNVDSPPYFPFGMVNMAETSSGFDMTLNVDRYAISSARIYPASMIEIGNNATYGQGTRLWQEPLYLSDGSIQIKADLTGLGAGPYYLWVTNNRQERSATYNLSDSGDVTPPTISSPLPSGEQAYGTTSVTLQVTTDEAATCKYHTSDVDYASMANTFGATGGTTHQQTGFSVTNGQNYTRYVRCIDGSDNSNTASATIQFSVAAAPPTANLLFSESFENTSWSARGWYDSSTQGSIVSGGQSGNALQWAWTSGGTTPTNGSAIRNTFTTTDEMFVQVYMKFSSTWRGSQQTYHPHMLLFPSTLDSDYAALANNYLNTYIEATSDVGSPYTIRPSTALQDSIRVNTANGTPPNNLTATTENRSVNYCNGYLSAQDYGSIQTCYSMGGGSWYSATAWGGISTTVPKDQWVKIETYFKMNSMSGGVAQSDGIMRQWIDGVLWLDKSNIVYRTNQDATKEWDKIVLAPWIGDGSPITQTMWIDELKIYDGIPSSEMVLSGLVPISGTKLDKTTTSTPIEVTTSVAATCRWGTTSGISWSSLTPYSTTGETTHSSTLPVVAGGVYQLCTRCFDTALSVYSADSCTSFSVNAKPKSWWWR